MGKQKEAILLVEGWGKQYIDALLSNKVDEYGVITSPGKFEGEHFIVGFFWGVGLEGAADEEIYDVDTQYFVFELAEWESLIPGTVYGLDEYSEELWLVLWEDDNGFINSYWLTESALNDLREGAQKEAEEAQDE